MAKEVVRLTYKTCPRCGQNAVMDMQQCQRCGHVFRQAGYQPIPYTPQSAPSPLRHALPLALLAILVVAGLVFIGFGASRSSQRPFVGIWYEAETHRTYTFNGDGSGLLALQSGESYPFTWYNSGNVLTTQQPQDGTAKVWAFPRAIWSVSDDGQHLTLSEENRTRDLTRR